MKSRERKIGGKIWTFYWFEWQGVIVTDLGEPNVYNSINGFNLCYNGLFTGEKIKPDTLGNFLIELELWIFNYKKLLHNAKRNKQQHEDKQNDG